MQTPFLIAQLTSRGGRPENEDHISAAEQDGVSCWVLADGLGGHAGGAVASSAVCRSAIDSFRANPAVSTEAVEAHIAKADATLKAAQGEQPDLASMRSTLVVLVADSSNAVWSHLGDSRLYHLRAGRILSQTLDHSLPQNMVDAGELSASQIRRHEDRGRLLRVAGEDGASTPTTLPAPARLRRGDAFLLCSDGFWENVTELEMELDFAKSLDPAEWLHLMETRLQERVSGAHDNYTAFAILGDRLPLPRPEAVPAAAPVRIDNDITERTVILKSGSIWRTITVALAPLVLILSALTFAHANSLTPARIRGWLRSKFEPAPRSKTVGPQDPRPGARHPLATRTEPVLPSN